MRVSELEMRLNVPGMVTSWGCTIKDTFRGKFFYARAEHQMEARAKVVQACSQEVGMPWCQGEPECKPNG
jgi:hypothetical protein